MNANDDYKPAGATQAKPLNPEQPVAAAKTEVDQLRDIVDRLKRVEAAFDEAKQRLWAEWQIVQDAIRSELHKFRSVLCNQSRVDHDSGGSLSSASPAEDKPAFTSNGESDATAERKKS